MFRHFFKKYGNISSSFRSLFLEAFTLVEGYEFVLPRDFSIIQKLYQLFPCTNFSLCFDEAPMTGPPLPSRITDYYNSAPQNDVNWFSQFQEMNINIKSVAGKKELCFFEQESAALDQFIDTLATLKKETFTELRVPDLWDVHNFISKLSNLRSLNLFCMGDLSHESKVVIPESLSNLIELDVCLGFECGFINIKNCVNLVKFSAAKAPLEAENLDIFGLSSCPLLKDLKLSMVTLREGLHPLTRLETLMLCAKVSEVLFENEENFENCAVKITSYYDRKIKQADIPEFLWPRLAFFDGVVSNVHHLTSLEAFYHDSSVSQIKFYDLSPCSFLTKVSLDNMCRENAENVSRSSLVPGQPIGLVIPSTCSLLSINLSGVQLSMVASLLKSSPFINSLFISDCVLDVSPSLLSQLSLIYLKDLSLNRCALYSYLPSLPRLTALSVYWVEDFDISIISEYPKLNSLRISYCRVSLSNLKPHLSVEFLSMVKCNSSTVDDTLISYLFPRALNPFLR
ncbi:hypothetical protein RCL1_000102 [Eukaryota sp. TZLM3-RCL]